MKHPILSILFLLTSLISMANGADDNAQSNIVKMDAAQQEALGIQAITVETVTDALGSLYPAKVVVPNAQLRVVSAPLAGLLESLMVAEGENVEAGQALAIIHSPELLELQSSYLEALTDLDLALTEMQRDKQLSAEGIIAKRRYLESSAKYTQLKTRVEQRKQSLTLAGMSAEDMKSLQRNRKLTSSLTVRAPLAGVVLEQSATPGSQLNVLDPIYKVGHLNPLWLEIHVPLEQLGEIGKGTNIVVSEPAVKGQVITVGRMVHGADQGVLIRAEVKQGVEALRPGQFVQAQIEQAQQDNVFRIARSALVRNEGQTWVFVAKEAGFLALPVNVVSEEATSLVINGELKPTDKVAIAGTAALKAAWMEGAE